MGGNLQRDLCSDLETALPNSGEQSECESLEAVTALPSAQSAFIGRYKDHLPSSWGGAVFWFDVKFYADVLRLRKLSRGG